MGKHSNETNDTPSTPSAHKKPRLTPKTLLFEDIVTKADVVLGMIPGMQAYIKDNHPQHLETLEYWRYTCEYAKQMGAMEGNSNHHA
jgi:sugar phosphate isomerase/epimerase